MADFLTAEEIAALLRHEGDATVSARTVHYYAEQKLLPTPDYHGNRPRYTERHLVAMREVRRRRRTGERLREILPGDRGDDTSTTPRQPEMVGTALDAVQPEGEMHQTRSISGPSTRYGRRTVAVGPGLTLAAEGWSDADLERIVRVIQKEINPQAASDAEQSRQGE